MKKILACALALVSALSFGATLNPISLLNPAGSTAGQVIMSAGPTGTPAWQTITPAGIGGLKASNNLSDVASATAALTNLGGLSTTLAASTYATITNLNLKAPLASPTFTGTVTVAALTATGAITPSQTAGIVGTTTNNNANAGSVGEYVTANATSVAAFGSGTAGNITSISLTAGDWDVTGLATAVGGTTVTSVGGGISTTSATFGALGTYVSQVATVGQGMAVTLPVRISIAGTTTVYLVANCIYTGTPTMSGLIRARRVR